MSKMTSSMCSNFSHLFSVANTETLTPQFRFSNSFGVTILFHILTIRVWIHMSNFLAVSTFINSILFVHYFFIHLKSLKIIHHNEKKFCLVFVKFTKWYIALFKQWGLKAYVSEDILNWHCLSPSLNANLCIHFYWLSRLWRASHRKMIQSSALGLCLRLCQFKISWDT